MAFGRQSWVCAALECEMSACASVVILVQGPGGRKDRIKANTKAVRLCPNHLRWLSEQLTFKPLASEIEQACRKVAPEAWATPKPKRVK